MSAVTYRFCCAGCGERFNAPEVPEFSYGLFVLRSENSDYAAFLDAFNDAAFLESYEIVKTNRCVLDMRDEQKGEIQQRVFCVVCDPDPDGHPLKIGLAPRCPSCGCRSMATWEQIDPSRPWPLPLVGHERWNVLTKQQKVDLVDQTIRAISARP